MMHGNSSGYMTPSCYEVQSKHAYLMYDGYHYNLIRYGNSTSHDKNFTMPIWVESPATRKEKRKRIVISLDDSDSDSGSSNEDHNNDENIHVKRHTQKKIKMEQKTGKLQCKKRKKTTIEEITPEHTAAHHATEHTRNTRRKRRHQRPVHTGYRPNRLSLLSVETITNIEQTQLCG
jgi:hypothetical protein